MGSNVAEVPDVCDDGWLLVWDPGLNIFIPLPILLIIWLGLNDPIYWEVLEVLPPPPPPNIIELGSKVCLLAAEFAETSLRNSKTYRFDSADMEYINVNKSTFGSILLFF